MWELEGREIAVVWGERLIAGLEGYFRLGSLLAPPGVSAKECESWPELRSEAVVLQRRVKFDGKLTHWYAIVRSNITIDTT